MPRIRSLLVGLLAPVLALALQQPASAATTSFSSGFQQLSLTTTSWADGSRHGAWKSVYNGYGVNGIALDGSHVLSESPKPSLSPDVTHAGLVTTRASYGDTDVKVDVRTVAQLRLPTPNPWEVGWVLWHYTDDTHFYYLVLKPNGWELGKEDPAYSGAQRYLRTGGSPTFAVGQWHHVHIRQVAAQITVWADGQKLTSFTDKQRPYAAGHLGLYNEDSNVHFDHVRIATP